MSEDKDYALVVTFSDAASDIGRKRWRDLFYEMVGKMNRDEVVVPSEKKEVCVQSSRIVNDGTMTFMSQSTGKAPALFAYFSDQTLAEETKSSFEQQAICYGTPLEGVSVDVMEAVYS